MRKIEITSWSRPDELLVTEGPPPVCKPGEVRIRIQATAITFSLSLLIQGKYQRKPPFPFIPGSFVAGYVTELGDGAEEFSVGDRVIASLETGGLAEETVVSEQSVYRIPDSLSFARANALNTSYSSVMAALTWRRALNVKSGETLLVTGGAGNVGIAAIEIGRTLGAAVIASASSAEKRAYALLHGATHAVESDTSRLRDTVFELTDGKGVHAALDPVGGATFTQAVRCLRPEGRISPHGFASGDIPTIPANIVMVKNIAICGINMGHYKIARRAHYRPMMVEMFDQLGRWFEQGRIDPVTSATFPIERVPEAFAAILSRSRTGHVVVVQDEEAKRLRLEQADAEEISPGE